MSKAYIIQEETLVSMADAIRTKKGTTDAIPVTSLAAEIESIETGLTPLYDFAGWLELNNLTSYGMDANGNYQWWQSTATNRLIVGRGSDIVINNIPPGTTITAKLTTETGKAMNWAVWCITSSGKALIEAVEADPAGSTRENSRLTKGTDYIDSGWLVNWQRYTIPDDTQFIWLNSREQNNSTLYEGYITAFEIYIDGGITPSGTLSITENGTYDVAEYASAEVSVAGGGSGGNIETCTIEFGVGNSTNTYTVYYTAYSNGLLVNNSATFSPATGLSLSNVVKNTIVCATIGIRTSADGGADHWYYSENASAFTPYSYFGAIVADQNLQLDFYDPRG